MTTNNIAYAAESAMTITLAGLATSSTFVFGREGTAISNTSAKALDYLLSGRVTVGTTPTIGTQIRIYCLSTIGTLDVWPDVFDGTNSDETLTSVGVGQGFLKRAAILNVDSNNSDRAYDFGKLSVAQLFGGVCPHTFTVFVTHNTGVNLNATGGNHFVVVEPITTTNT